MRSFLCLLVLLFCQKGFSSISLTSNGESNSTSLEFTDNSSKIIDLTVAPTQSSAEIVKISALSGLTLDTTNCIGEITTSCSASFILPENSSGLKIVIVHTKNSRHRFFFNINRNINLGEYTSSEFDENISIISGLDLGVLEGRIYKKFFIKNNGQKDTVLNINSELNIVQNRCNREIKSKNNCSFIALIDSQTEFSGINVKEIDINNGQDNSKKINIQYEIENSLEKEEVSLSLTNQDPQSCLSSNPSNIKSCYFNLSESASLDDVSCSSAGSCISKITQIIENSSANFLIDINFNKNNFDQQLAEFNSNDLDFSTNNINLSSLSVNDNLNIEITNNSNFSNLDSKLFSHNFPAELTLLQNSSCLTRVKLLEPGESCTLSFLVSQIPPIFTPQISFNNTTVDVSQENPTSLLDPGKFNASCNCYEDVPYTDDNSISWTVLEGGTNSVVVRREMDIYLPTVSSGKGIIYSHPMNDSKTIDTTLEISLKNLFLSLGYTFISVEFRHPILESQEIALPNGQNDLIESLRTIRENHQELQIASPTEISSISYSKGSLLLANILNSSDPRLVDSFGQISLEKMYLFDAQITYNYDSYYDNFIDKSPITIFLGGFPVGTISALAAYDEINNTAQSTFGFSLTQDLQVVDSLRFVENSSNMNALLNYPEIHFGYNQIKNGLLSPADVADSLVPLVINTQGVDYFLHNPESETLFCGEYINYGNCTGTDGLNFSLTAILNDVQNFFQ